MQILKYIFIKIKRFYRHLNQILNRLKLIKLDEYLLKSN